MYSEEFFFSEMRCWKHLFINQSFVMFCLFFLQKKMIGYIGSPESQGG